MKSDGSVVESSSFYPSGMRFGESVALGGNVQPYRHTGHEMQSMHGLNWIDNLARFRTVSDGGSLPSVDPLCEKHYSISPYAYCMNNPIRLIDPKGKDVYNINQNTGQIEIVKTKEQTHSYYIVDGKGNKSLVGSFAYNKKGLVQLPKSLTFNNLQGKQVGFSVKNGSESKSFVSSNAMASLIGTVANANIKDLTINQFSNANGSSPAPSVSHKNGTNGDLRYLRTDESGGSVVLGSPNVDVNRQNTLNDALYLFGWKDMISERFNGGQLLDHASSAQERGIPSDHTTHLHLQGYSPNVVTTYTGTNLDEVEVTPNNE
jgi:RHS repeat-associated protein